MSLGMTYSPTVPVGGAASYKYWPVTNIGSVQTFSGDFFGWRGEFRGGHVGGSFHGGICHGGR